MSSITIELVMVGGKVDSEATMDAFSDALSDFMTQHETESATLGAAVQSILSANSGRAIATPVLCSLALNSINVSPENYAALDMLARQYIKDNSQGDDSLLVRVKGAHGGVSLRSDTAARKPAKAAK
jgi:sugar (pentulose or hexulose) kinase